MDMKHHWSPMDGPSIAAVFYMLLLTHRCVLAQSPPPDSSNNNNNYHGYGKFSPTMTIVFVVIISAFFFLGFFSIYIRSCGRGDGEFSASFRFRAMTRAARSRRQQGLSPEVIETFPTMVYSEVKGLRADKGALECAVCLSEFDDDEELRLLPHCNHVFHPDCIGAWLTSHVTCPVCRANLAQQATATADLAPPPDTEGPSQDHVAIVVDTPATHSEEDAIELARIGSLRRAARSRSGRPPMKFPRSHSTGHSMICPVENVDRYTLRLPEHVRKEILSARKLHRWASCIAVPNGEGAGASSQHGSRGGGGYEGEGSSRRCRSFRFGKSDRWPSFFFRTLSVKIPAWAAGRKAESEGEGSVKKEEGDGPTRGQVVAVRESMERPENGSAAVAGTMKPPESSTF